MHVNVKNFWSSSLTWDWRREGRERGVEGLIVALYWLYALANREVKFQVKLQIVAAHQLSTVLIKILVILR